MGDKYLLYFIPWDTDMILGLRWNNDRMENDYDYTMSLMTYRQEYDNVKLGNQMSVCWKELRSTVYTEDTIISLLEHHMRLLNQSGAMERDRQQNGLQNGGQDTWELLEKFCIERLYYLDQQYNAG